MTTMTMSSLSYQDFMVPLLSGGVAGLTVDLMLFPMDTVKTRLQSRQGFLKAGGFQKIYAGVGPAVAGSIPSAALFFCTYELVKTCLSPRVPKHAIPLLHIFAASMGEVVSNIFRVPFEVIKQRAQASAHLRPMEILRHAIRTEGLRGLYRGYLSTISREIPFSFIQYPLWEFLKATVRERRGGHLEPWEGAVCGAVAGGTAAGITTPLDVAKTRIMLAKSGDLETRVSIPKVILTIARTQGITGLFAGFFPRVCGMSVGGFIFLGAYDKVHHVLSST